MLFTCLSFCSWTLSLQMKPCQNGGKCRVIWNDFVCSCPLNFSRKTCDTRVWCVSDPCDSGTRCVDLPDGYECEYLLWRGFIGSWIMPWLLLPELPSSTVFKSTSEHNQRNQRCLRSVESARMRNINNADYIDYVLGYSPKRWKTVTRGEELLNKLLFSLRSKSNLVAS